MNITYQPIGVIHSPFTDLVSMPIQPTSAASGPGRIEIYAPFVEGLKPYVPVFDHSPVVRTGWLEGVKGNIQAKVSDGRFA